jgi:ParB family chromosome partitioning protein
VASFKTIRIDQIHVIDRLRPVGDDIALAIGSSMAERGLINPITVRPTPAANGGKTPYTLIAGATRLRGAELLGWEKIDTIVVSVDGVEAQMMEVSENLYRNELSALDRAMFVLKFRELWEEKHGKIEQGGDRRSKDHDDPSGIYAPGRQLSEEIQNRLGFGPASFKRVNSIGQNLRPELRQALRGTPAEYDQSQLLKMAKMEPVLQGKIAAGLKAGGDLKTVLSWTKADKFEVDPQQQLLERLCRDWEKASEETREEFLRTIGMSDGADPVMQMIKEAAE